ncbi:MAG: deoxyribose-phosphate aldolase, partial [Candidatus Riesia sp.]|nr:deoxyribose-phosphate aldolase [Candidatus Riesia sp.]
NKTKKMIKNFEQYFTINENIEFDKISGLIDYTELDPNVSEEELYELAKISTNYNFATMCVMPTKVKYLKGVLDEMNKEKGSNVGITTVISFPHGTNSLMEKITECRKAISDGADEIDMVLNYKNLIKLFDDSIKPDEMVKMRNGLEREVLSLSDICHDNGKILKVIVESGELTDDQTRMATEICLKSNADFIKTSTGKTPVGAELDKVLIMKKLIEDDIFSNHFPMQIDKMKIKASGGIRTANDVRKFLPYVDRFGIGYQSVNNILGIDRGTDSDGY